MLSIDSKTKYVGLFGYPLGHTLSPLMQNAAFQNKKINNIYIPLEISRDDFGEVVMAIKHMNFIGFNVTIPYKIDIIKYLDEVDTLARHIGAVNTVIIKEGKLIGYNTDGIGFLRSLEESLGIRVESKNIFVLGSGGAARAVCTTLALNGAKNICICNRTYERAVDLAKHIGSFSDCSIRGISMDYKCMKEELEKADILVNATNIGMFPNVNETPVDKSILNSKLMVYDIVYNPIKTKLLMEAEKIGCKVVSGLGMLVYQGVEAFELWTGTKAPIDLMQEVVNKAVMP